MKIKAVKIISKNNFLRGRNELQLKFNCYHRPPHPPYTEKGGGFGPLSTNRVEMGGQEKNGSTQPATPLGRQKDKESRHIEAGKKKFLLTTQIL